MTQVVSVLMLAYDQEQYINAAIDSVLAQQLDCDIELVIAEDCSRDGTRTIAERYSSSHSGIVRLLHRPRNMGPQANFADAWRSCRGDYIAILEGDDMWTSPTKLAAQVQFLRDHPNVTVCGHQARVIDESGTQLGVVPPAPPGQPSLRDLIYGDFIPNCSVMYRAGVVETVPAWIAALPMADWPMHVIHAARGSLGFIPQVLAAYRVHPGGLWSSRPRAEQLSGIMAFYRALEENLDPSHRSTIRSASAKHSYAAAREYAYAGLIHDGRQLLQQGLRTHAVMPDARLIASLYAPGPVRAARRLRRLLGSRQAPA